MLATVRVAIPDYSPEGFREALHNALVHRDYAKLGTVLVQWRGSEMEISNPGGFVSGVTPENILVTQPRARNLVLADAFKRVGLVERSGRGVDTIYEGQLRYGRPAPNYAHSSDDAVQLILRGGRANLALARWFVEHSSVERPVTVEDMIIVNALDQQRHLTIEQALGLPQTREAEARGHLERLVEQGVLEVVTVRRHGRRYQLSHATYQAIGDPAAYVRRRGFSAIQHQQMVLNWLESNGRITRADVAELCQLAPDDASALLRQMVDAGQLLSHANRRWSYYTKS